MTKVNIETNAENKYTLGDLEIGDFFLDNAGNLCVVVEYDESENFVHCYDFVLEANRCIHIGMAITYLKEVKITY